jgi:hypothetical protein
MAEKRGMAIVYAWSRSAQSVAKCDFVDFAEIRAGAGKIPRIPRTTPAARPFASPIRGHRLPRSHGPAEDSVNGQGLTLGECLGADPDRRRAAAKVVQRRGYLAVDFPCSNRVDGQKARCGNPLCAGHQSARRIPRCDLAASACGRRRICRGLAEVESAPRRRNRAVKGPMAAAAGETRRRHRARILTMRRSGGTHAAINHDQSCRIGPAAPSVEPAGHRKAAPRPQWSLGTRSAGRAASGPP